MFFANDALPLRGADVTVVCRGSRLLVLLAVFAEGDCCAKLGAGERCWRAFGARCNDDEVELVTPKLGDA